MAEQQDPRVKKIEGIKLRHVGVEEERQMVERLLAEAEHKFAEMRLRYPDAEPGTAVFDQIVTLADQVKLYQKRQDEIEKDLKATEREVKQEAQTAEK